MTTFDKATSHGTTDHPASTAPLHDSSTPFYAVGGADPDFAPPAHDDSPAVGFWARLLPSGRAR